ncbi:hypothetical protein FRX31_015560 [Thalictrum thalictroides]|uniref:Uncharacterized protein n=1 Tax=Thalictrum thalictroides TaxID=46969 RepID=A0A7J6WBP9_THATH|nr:hypothetical protein FRX31_015560 [Thalictrum thalictroides]
MGKAETKTIKVSKRDHSLISEKKVSIQVMQYLEASCMDPIISYLREGTLPEKKSQARSIKEEFKRYALIQDELYRLSPGGPLLKCVHPSQWQLWKPFTLKINGSGHLGRKTYNDGICKELV